MPDDVGDAHRRGRLPRHRAQRVEVGAHHEVAIAALPRGHREALDRGHVDVDREQVVAALGAVLGHLVDEVMRDQPLAHQAALHVGDREQDGVDLPPLDQIPKLLERHRCKKVQVPSHLGQVSCMVARAPAPANFNRGGSGWRGRASFRRGRGS